jgi:hypothetical protein
MDLHLLKEPIKARNVDVTPKKLGTITHSTSVTLLINGRQFNTTFLITGLGKEDVILGLPWLRKVNPAIDWRKATLEFCEEDQLARVQAIVAKTRENWGKLGEKVSQVPRNKLPPPKIEEIPDEEKPLIKLPNVEWIGPLDGTTETKPHPNEKNEVSLYPPRRPTDLHHFTRRTPP